MVLKIERFQPEGMNVRMSGGQPSYSHVVTVSGTGKSAVEWWSCPWAGSDWIPATPTRRRSSNRGPSWVQQRSRSVSASPVAKGRHRSECCRRGDAD